MIRVLFFAQLREDLGCSELTIDSIGVDKVSDVSNILLLQHPTWSTFLNKPNLRVAVNQAYAKADSPVSSGDEVAFFPPVTGG
jgi:molybdopterin synthase sulfur carrier subunit